MRTAHPVIKHKNRIVKQIISDDKNWDTCIVIGISGGCGCVCVGGGGVGGGG